MNAALLYGKINDRVISIHLTKNALCKLEKATSPIYVGMELYFTSFVQKKVIFLDQQPDVELTKITDNLYLYFKSLQPKTSKVKNLKGDATDMIELPIKRKGALVPKYLKIDYSKNKWHGDFTWKSGNKHLKPILLNYN